MKAEVLMWDCWSTVIYCQHACRPRSQDRENFGAIQGTDWWPESMAHISYE